jgi:hypothetical protein
MQEHTIDLRITNGNKNDILLIMVGNHLETILRVVLHRRMDDMRGIMIDSRLDLMDPDIIRIDDSPIMIGSNETMVGTVTMQIRGTMRKGFKRIVAIQQDQWVAQETKTFTLAVATMKDDLMIKRTHMERTNNIPNTLEMILLSSQNRAQAWNLIR